MFLSTTPDPQPTTFNATSATLTTTTTAVRDAAKSDFWAVHLTETSVDIPKAAPLLRAAGVNGVRIVVGFGGWDVNPSASRFSEAREWIAAGFQTTICINATPFTLPENEAVVTAWAQKLVKNNPDLAFAKGNRWEIGNEWHDRRYASFSLTDGVKRILAPIYKVLKPAGHRLVGFSIASSSDENLPEAAKRNKARLKEMFDAGYAQACDEGSYHVYAATIEQFRNAYESAREGWDPSLPFDSTEWGGHPDATHLRTRQERADFLAGATLIVRANADKAALYRIRENTTTQGGVIGLLSADWKSPNEPYYTAFKNASAAPLAPPPPAPDPTPPPAPTAKITKLSVYDAPAIESGKLVGEIEPDGTLYLDQLPATWQLRLDVDTPAAFGVIDLIDSAGTVRNRIGQGKQPYSVPSRSTVMPAVPVDDYRVRVRLYSAVFDYIRIDPDSATAPKPFADLNAALHAKATAPVPDPTPAPTPSIPTFDASLTVAANDTAWFDRDLMGVALPQHQALTLWDFGDGTKYAQYGGFVAAHAWAAAGEISATETVVNGDTLEPLAQKRWHITVAESPRETVHVSSAAELKALASRTNPLRVLVEADLTFTETIVLRRDSGVKSVIDFQGHKVYWNRTDSSGRPQSGVFFSLSGWEITNVGGIDGSSRSNFVNIHGTLGVAVTNCVIDKVQDFVNGNDGAQKRLLVQDNRVTSDDAIAGYLTWSDNAQVVMLGNTCPRSRYQNTVRFGGARGITMAFNSISNVERGTRILHRWERATLWQETAAQGNVGVGPLLGGDGVTKPQYWLDAMENVQIIECDFGTANLGIDAGAHGVLVRNTKSGSLKITCADTDAHPIVKATGLRPTKPIDQYQADELEWRYYRNPDTGEWMRVEDVLVTSDCAFAKGVSYVNQSYGVNLDVRVN